MVLRLRMESAVSGRCDWLRGAQVCLRAAKELGDHADSTKRQKGLARGYKDNGNADLGACGRVKREMASKTSDLSGSVEGLRC